MTNDPRLRDITRRHFFRDVGFGIGSLALTSLVNERLFAATPAYAGQSLGSGIHFMDVFKILPNRPELRAYAERCRARPGFRRAAALESA